jgi:hypothetical protein
LVSPGMLPPIISTTPNSPSVCEKGRAMAESSPGHARCSSIRQKVYQVLKPLTVAASPS